MTNDASKHVIPADSFAETSMVEDGKNRPFSPFVHAEERRLQYAQTLSKGQQTFIFSIAQTGPTVSNRDMGELMSRDRQFAKGVAHQGSHSRQPLQELEAIKPLVIVPEGRTESGSNYTRLISKDHFRLLEILPGTGEATLQCRLHVCSMRDNHGAYEALSYTWKTGWEYYGWVKIGPKNPKIECNGVEMAVGANLYMALHRLRREDSTRVVWADAICVNQSDVHERSQQVAAMGDIFRNAYSVLVWLGADEDADKVSDTVARASSKAFAGVCSVVSTWAAATEHTILAERPQYRIQGSAKDFSGDGPLSAESTIWLKVLELYERRWFLRLWVVQEIALARRATVIWGGCEISWQWIGLVAAIIRTNWNRIVPDYYGWDSNESSRLVPVGVMNAYFMYRISSFQNYFNPLRFSFCELLTLTRQFKCEDERDKVFGLLGLTTTDGVNSSITPDYTQPLAEVYRNIAFAMIRSTKSLAFLSHVHHRDTHDHASFDIVSSDTRKTGPALPSWIPKWGVVGPQTLTPLDVHPDFAAGLPKPAQFRDADETGDPDRLVVRGVVLEDVKDTKWTGFLSFEPQDYCDKGEGLEQLLARHGHTRSGLEKLAMTLAAGKSWYGTPVADRAGMLADFADCLVTHRLWWALKPDAFGSTRPGKDEEKGIGRENKSEDQRILNDNTSFPPAEGPITMHELKAISTRGNGNLFVDAVATACVGRRLFCTVSAMRGVGPLDTQFGDKVCVIYGTPVPFIIRRCEEKQGYTLVGECYIDDIMHGEAHENGRYEETWIDLV
ncbi:hypothetical protein DL769_005830 [Monosporascus sp. CRB-8-3]|nr:hypothetical protein DL769_005830 [Monosporascus sp. CRB-8-3]